jgi:hydroxysqualene synthase
MLEPPPPLKGAPDDAPGAGPTDQPIPLSLAYQACEAIARRHYENFPVASWFLTPDRRQALAALYAFARIADDIADAERPSADRLAGLDRVESDLVRALDGDPPDPILVALADAIDRHRLPAEPLFDMLEAFRMDARDAVFPTWDDLLVYCRGSANTIGRVVLALYGVEDARAQSESDALCTALQLTNFWQDLGPDLARGRLFVPLEDLDRFGLSREALTDPASAEPVTRLIEHECRATEELFDRGRGIVRRVPFGLALQLRATIAGGSAVLEAVLRRGAAVVHDRPRLGAFSRARIAAAACLGITG